MEIPQSEKMAKAYSILRLPIGSPLEIVESTYFKLRAEKIQHGQRDEIAALKAAYQSLKETLSQESDRSKPMPQTVERESISPLKQLQQRLQTLGVQTPHVSLHQHQLMIGVRSKQFPKAAKAIAKLYPFLQQHSSSRPRPSICYQNHPIFCESAFWQNTLAQDPYPPPLQFRKRGRVIFFPLTVE